MVSWLRMSMRAKGGVGISASSPSRFSEWEALASQEKVKNKTDESYFSPMTATLVYCRELGPRSNRAT
jgi:hypothetical protein